MPSIQEIVGEVASIKTTSGELLSMVTSANVNLANQCAVITNLVRGNRGNGENAVKLLSIAVRSLSNAAASIKTLERTCDDCIKNMS